MAESTERAPHSSRPKVPPGRGGRVPALVPAGFALLSILLAATWWRGMVPFPFLGGDAGNIASFAAAWSDPGRWAGDMALADADGYRFYATAHIPLLMMLEPLVGDFGTAFVLLLAPTLWLQAVGFWMLGRVLFRHPGGAVALGLVSFGTVPLTVDYYGTFVDAQPRFLFQALLPFLLRLMIARTDRPTAWPGLFALHGLSMYAHPVSAPSVALASWCALALGGDRRTGGPRRFPWLLGSGVLFLALIAPFAVIYLGGHEHGAVADYDMERARQAVLFGSHFTDGWAYVSEVLRDGRARWFVPLWGLAGLASVWVLAPGERPRVRPLIVWMVVAAGGALAITLAEQAASRALQVLPPEIDTIRNVRYAVPILMLFGVWGVVEATRRLPRPWAVLALALSSVVWLGVNKPGVVPVRATLACLAEGRLFCPPAEWGERRAMLEVVRERTPAGALVLPVLDRDEGIDVVLAVRYYALRPVAHGFKDGGTTLGYANRAALDRWAVLGARIVAARRDGDWPAIGALADEVGARTIVTDLPPAPSAGWSVLHSGGRYSVLVRSAT